jgi:hypothetical protein
MEAAISTGEEFRRRAEETEAFARRLGPSDRARYLDYAAAWRALAEELEARDQMAGAPDAALPTVALARP